MFFASKLAPTGGARQIQGNKKADPNMDRLDNNPEGLLLAACFFKHAQGALVSFVSSLLCFLGSSQSFISLR